MKYVAYHRTSTKEQHLDRGIKEINEFCILSSIKLYKGKVYTDQQTGKNFDRPRYNMLVDEILEPGDCLIVTEVDRLGRNKREILRQLHMFQDKNIRLMILEIPTTCQNLDVLDNSMAKMIMETINHMLIELFAAMAQAELEKREKRQREGIQSKKERGEWGNYGRPRVMSQEVFNKEYERVEQGELAPFELMKELGLSKGTYYRYRRDYYSS